MSRLHYKVLVVVLLAIIFLGWLPTQIHASTYTVSKTADTNDGTCNADCSLREAIVAANANAGADTIEFAIPTNDANYTAPSGSTQGFFTITFTTSVPNLTDSSGVFINGYSQTGSSRNSTAMGGTINSVLNIRVTSASLANTLTITSDSNHLAGLNISNSTGSITILVTGSNNWLEGNFIGSNITGTSSGGGSQINVLSGGGNIFGTNGDGTSDVGERNLFHGTSSQYKVQLATGGTGSGNIFAGNYMGMDVTSRVCAGVTQTRSMIAVFGTTGARIGSNFDGVSDSEEANILGCVTSDARGVIQAGGTATGLVIQGNYIGTNLYGDQLSSFAIPGFRDNGSSIGTLIKRNVIHYNGDRGIALITAGSINNTFSQNSIYNNTGLGIDLLPVGVNANDAGDVDTGMNNLMNYPVITKVVKSGNNLLVTANLDFKASEAPFTIELFTNDAIDSTGYGEGQTYVGSVTTSSIGNSQVLTIPITGATPTSAGKITATATNGTGSTSEFSAPPSDTNLYTDSTKPGINLVSEVKAGNDGQSRLYGNAQTNEYTLTTVQYSVNGGDWRTATATDGNFDEANEDFYFDFKSNDNNNTKDGYLVKARAQNANNLWSENVVYFSPFVLNSPENQSTIESAYPTFTFSVNQQLGELQNNLVNYQIKIQQGNGEWQTLIDSIPITSPNSNSTYETNDFSVTYTNNSSTISVTSKITPLAGTYSWKAVAFDKAGHSQETNSWNVTINSATVNANNTEGFPLAILNISGLGNPNLSSYNLAAIKKSYSTQSLAPIFYGIAWANSTVTIQLTDQNCSTDCSNIYKTTTQADSRFGINIPRGQVASGKAYTVNASVTLDNNYTQLPPFTLVIGGATQTVEKNTSIPSVSPEVLMSPVPEQPLPEQPAVPESNKRCFWFICF
jgi:CSLREA domain-containing protein